MSIASEIARIKDNISNAYSVCEDKGAIIPLDKNSTNLADCISSIGSGKLNIELLGHATEVKNSMGSNYFVNNGITQDSPRLNVYLSFNDGTFTVLRDCYMIIHAQNYYQGTNVNNNNSVCFKWTENGVEDSQSLMSYGDANRGKYAEIVKPFKFKKNDTFYLWRYGSNGSSTGSIKIWLLDQSAYNTLNGMGIFNRI